jgi:hypothetical protein
MRRSGSGPLHRTCTSIGGEVYKCRLVTNALALHTANALDAFLDIANGTLICRSTRRNGASKEQFQLRRKFGNPARR